MTLDDATYLAALTAAGEAVTDLVGPDQLEHPVPACPGWTVADLLGHLGTMQRWATGLVGGGIDGDFRFRDVPEAPTDGAVLDWVQTGGRELASTFERVDLTAPVHTWAGEQDGRWWLRRAALETVLHTWDAADGAGSSYTIDPGVAVDGLDETFEVFAHHRFHHDDFGPEPATLHLHATDVEGEWMVRVADGTVTCTHEHAKGDVAVRGSAADLWLVLWNRVTPDAVEVFGDAGVLDRWRHAAAV